MVPEDETSAVGEEPKLDVEQVKRQLDMFDQRLDNIDSVVTVLVERVMKQPVTLNMTCPHCGKAIEVAVIGSHKPTK